MPRVVIVGGGITGLSAAYYLDRLSDFEVTLLEGSDRLGGKVQTERDGELVVEVGPDSIFTRKPWAMNLISDLEIGCKLVEPMQREFSMLIHGRLRTVPSGLASLTSVDASSVSRAAFLSETAKHRVLEEWKIPKGPGGDESVASFFRRRFGDEFSRLVAEPLLAGTHAGDPDKLSMAALYPTYLAAEQKYGNLSGLPEGSSPVTVPRQATFVSLTGGMQTLVDEIVKKLQNTQLRTQATVEKIEFGSVTLAAGEVIEADHILVTVPSFVAADLLGNDALRKIRHASSAIVTLGYDSATFPKLEGTGFLVPQSESSGITGCTWTSSKWPGRAPDNTVLLRVFMGSDGGLNVEELYDGELIDLATKSIAQILDLEHPPVYEKLQRWHRGLPQYELGHLDLLKKIEDELIQTPGIYLAGASYRGVGIPDCIKQGREAAVAIAVEIDEH